MMMQSNKFLVRFALFLVVFALGLSLAIFFRECWDGFGPSFARIFVWQTLTWVPLVLVPLVLSRLVGAIDRNRRPLWQIIVYAAMLLLLAAHVAWFIGVSVAVSPLSGLPSTRFGVYPYFFLFYAMMDIAIFWGLMVRVGLQEMLQPKPSRDREEIISVKDRGNTILLPPATIHWIAAEDYYAKIYSEKGAFLLRQPLKVLADRLPAEKFVQIHRSTLVNLDYVDSHQAGEVVLKDGTCRSASRAGLQRLVAALAPS